MFSALKRIAYTDRFLRRPPGVYAREMRQLQVIEASYAVERAQLQENRLHKTLAQARLLPGYSEAPASNNLSEWEILTKQDILGREADFATQTFYFAPHAETGGTTGMPLRMKRSISGIAYEQALVDYLCDSMGIDASKARIAMLKGDYLDPALARADQFWFDIGRRKRVYSSFHISAENADHYRQSLVDYAPDILFCYPSAVDTLVKYLGDDSGVQIPLVFTSSEVLHEAIGERVSRALGCDIIDYYGHAERLVAAYNVNGGSYRFLPSYGYAELLPCGDGLARIVATTLRPNGQIFVRYDTGDLARVPSHDPKTLELIALGLLPFDGIVGRDNEVVDLPDGRRVFSLNQIPRGADGANSVQLHYNGFDKVDIYVVPGQQFSAQTCDHIDANFYQKFPRTISNTIWTVAAPLREPNGKAPLLLRDPVLPVERAAAGLWSGAGNAEIESDLVSANPREAA